MAPVLFLFWLMAFAETLETEWIKADLKMINLRQHFSKKALPADVALTPLKHGKVDCYINNLFSVILHSGDNDERATNDVPLAMHIIGRRVFFPPPGFLRQKLNLSTKNNKRKRKLLVTNTKQESHESRYKREETTYDNLPETRLIVVKDGFVTFCRHFKYLGSWISFSLREDHDKMKRLVAANASMAPRYGTITM